MKGNSTAPDVDLELNRVYRLIKESKAKLVYIQLPDGLKPEAGRIQESIENNTNAEVIIWAGSCFGACDVPKVDCDLLIQWGHSEW